MCVFFIMNFKRTSYNDITYCIVVSMVVSSDHFYFVRCYRFFFFSLYMCLVVVAAPSFENGMNGTEKKEHAKMLEYSKDTDKYSLRRRQIEPVVSFYCVVRYFWCVANGIPTTRAACVSDRKSLTHAYPH